MAECAIPGCGKPVKGRGWCSSHYQQWLQNRDDVQRVCAVEGCGSAHYARGWCRRCYGRWRRHGDPLRVDPVGQKVVGANPTYSTIHERMRIQRGPASRHDCIDCGSDAKHWSYRGGAPDELIDPKMGCPYSPDPDYYEPRCVPCHWRHDAS